MSDRDPTDEPLRDPKRAIKILVPYVTVMGLIGVFGGLLTYEFLASDPYMGGVWVGVLATMFAFWWLDRHNVTRGDAHV